MAIVVYQCSVCKREIELVQNKRGLEAVGPCSITQGCRGKLKPVRVYKDFIRGRLPADVVGLENWRQRKMLYNHTQVLEKQNWTIPHNLGTFPYAQVFVNTAQGQTEIIPENFKIIDDNTVELSFDRPYSGFAQLVARASDPDLLQPRTAPSFETPPEKIQISNQGEVTVAIKYDVIGQIQDSITMTIQFVANDGSFVTNDYLVDSTPSVLSPWHNKNTVIIKGKTYTIRSFPIMNQLIAEGTINNGSLVEFFQIDPLDNVEISMYQVDLTNNEILIPFDSSSSSIKDYTPYFRPNTIFAIQDISGGSTANKGVWVVEKATFEPASGKTRIKVTEPLNDNQLGKIVSSGSRDINQNEVLILLATGPGIYDKEENSYIDVSTAKGLSSLYYNQGELSCFSTVIQKVYPPIRSLVR